MFTSGMLVNKGC